MMTEKELVTILNRIGKRCFVRFFKLFASNIPREQMIEELQKMQNKEYADGNPLWEPWREIPQGKKWDESGCQLRVDNALLIFKARKQNRALEIVRDSTRLPHEDKMCAKELLKG